MPKRFIMVLLSMVLVLVFNVGGRLKPDDDDPDKEEPEVETKTVQSLLFDDEGLWNHGRVEFISVSSS